eukprot:322643-Rhodomonas_salina.2
MNGDVELMKLLCDTTFCRWLLAERTSGPTTSLSTTTSSPQNPSRSSFTLRCVSQLPQTLALLRLWYTSHSRSLPRCISIKSVLDQETQTPQDQWNVGPGEQANSPEAIAKGAKPGQVLSPICLPVCTRSSAKSHASDTSC